MRQLPFLNAKFGLSPVHIVDVNAPAQGPDTEYKCHATECIDAGHRDEHV